MARLGEGTGGGEIRRRHGLPVPRAGYFLWLWQVRGCMGSGDESASERLVVLRDGVRGVVRPIRPSDREDLVRGLEMLSPESRIRRFFFNKEEFSERELDRLTNPDGIDHLAYTLDILSEDGREATPVAVARCFRDQREKDLAEVALVTADEWQGDGVGGELMRSLTEAAVKVGIRRWFAAIFADNVAMHRLLNRFGTMLGERAVGDGVVEVVYEIG